MLKECLKIYGMFIWKNVHRYLILYLRKPLSNLREDTWQNVVKVIYFNSKMYRNIWKDVCFEMLVDHFKLVG